MSTKQLEKTNTELETEIVSLKTEIDVIRADIKNVNIKSDQAKRLVTGLEADIQTSIQTLEQHIKQNQMTLSGIINIITNQASQNSQNKGEANEKK